MITDYASLQQAIADWLARADLSAQIPTFIQLAESRFNRDLRVASMQTTAYDTSDSASNTITLPADCRAVQSLRVNAGGQMLELHPLPPESLADNVTSAYPIGYVTVGDMLQLVGGTAGSSDTTSPTDATAGIYTYALTYFQAIPSLSGDATTNWLLTREPALYLYGALIEASPYIGDDNRAAVWATQYTTLIRGMQAEDDRARYGNSPSIASPLRNAP